MREKDGRPRSYALIVANDDVRTRGPRATGGIEGVIVSVNPVLLGDEIPTLGDVLEDLRMGTIRIVLLRDLALEIPLQSLEVH
jgi:hypothetical protein